MRRQLIRNSKSAAIHRLAGGLAAALLTVLGPITAARAIPFTEFVLAGPVAGAGLVRSDFEATASTHAYEPDFGTVGFTVTGPFAAPDGESSGMVFCWTATAGDPAYLFTVNSLFPRGIRSWTRGDEILPELPNLGVVPGGNLSVFDTGAVDVISWNFLEFSCALLALRVEDYVRLKKVFDPGEFDLNALSQSLSAVPDPATSLLMGQRFSVAPDPATSLLMGQGLLILALLGRSSRQAS